MKFLALIFLSFSQVLFATSLITSISGTELLTQKEITLNAERQKGLVVVFLSAKCPCSNSHIEEIKSLSALHKNFSFVAIHSNADEPKDISKPYFEKANLPFPVIEDSNAKLADQFRAIKTPHSFVFSSDGHILYQGGVSNSKDCEKADRKFLREALDDIHNKKAVRTPEGRTLGCAISRGEKHVW